MDDENECMIWQLIVMPEGFQFDGTKMQQTFIGPYRVGNTFYLAVLLNG